MLIVTEMRMMRHVFFPIVSEASENDGCADATEQNVVLASPGEGEVATLMHDIVEPSQPGSDKKHQKRQSDYRGGG